MDAVDGWLEENLAGIFQAVLIGARYPAGGSEKIRTACKALCLKGFSRQAL